MSLSMSNLPKSLLEGPVGGRAVREPCPRCDLERSTTGRDGLTGTQANRGKVSLKSGDDVLQLVSVPESPPLGLYDTVPVQLYRQLHVKCCAFAMFNCPEVVVRKIC